MDVEPQIFVSARRSAIALAARLEQRDTDRVVFAESCTAGMVAALLGQVPGISNWLCGSAVTYRESLKMGWLGVSARTLEQHTAESLVTTSEMAIGVLQKTEEATWSAAVTGHLGPGAPAEIDGWVFVSVARRMGDTIKIATTSTCQLDSTTRLDRQYEAAKSVIELLLLQLI